MSSGFFLIISAPSGAGKSTVCKRLLERDSTLRYSISATTRAARPGEVDGRDYFFVTSDEFHRRVVKGQMLEWAQVHGNSYGTPKRFIEERIQHGEVVLLAIDVQGAASIRSRHREAVTVFLLPPSWMSLEQRLKNRRDSPDSIRTRLLNARKELRRAKEYDYWVVNDSLETAVKQVEAIILAERLKAGRTDPSRLSGLTRSAAPKRALARA
ncbi:MAG TPA: guanylate kinase [Elusimicrobiota bacterium]|jgi:guanylate kinase|nr:guanylate kinase [Elusimicrobiota bacterium]